MRILVAGAAGAIGRQLVPMLIRAGYQVAGTTRSPLRAEEIRSTGADPVLVDVLDGAAVRRVMIDIRPDAVIHQLTELSGGFGSTELRATARLRRVGTRHIVTAMRAAGVALLVAQSGAWLYASGSTPHGEADPLRDRRDAPDDLTLPGIATLERLTLTTPGIEGIVLRYGFLYGPGTAYEERDSAPVPRVHVRAAARAAVLAIEAGKPGIYNVVDDGDSVSNRLARDVLGWSPNTVVSSATGAGSNR